VQVSTSGDGVGPAGSLAGLVRNDFPSRLAYLAWSGGFGGVLLEANSLWGVGHGWSGALRGASGWELSAGLSTRRPRAIAGLEKAADRTAVAFSRPQILAPKFQNFHKSGRPDSRISTNPDARIPEFQKFGSLDSRILEAKIPESKKSGSLDPRRRCTHKHNIFD
jgi:hypothetical protein